MLADCTLPRIKSERRSRSLVHGGLHDIPRNCTSLHRSACTTVRGSEGTNRRDGSKRSKDSPRGVKKGGKADNANGWTGSGCIKNLIGKPFFPIRSANCIWSVGYTDDALPIITVSQDGVDVGTWAETRPGRCPLGGH